MATAMHPIAPFFWPNIKKRPAVIYAFLFIVFIIASIVYSLCLDAVNPSYYVDSSINNTVRITQKRQIEFPPIICTNQTLICPETFPIVEAINDQLSTPTCPDYFRWIHEDLKPWKDTGITRDMVESAKGTAHFRLAIKNGKAYMEKYKKSIQTRDKFTTWGILQLLRKYPGRLPDLELMFDCDDRPVVMHAKDKGVNKTRPPPLFRYCGDKWTDDVVFPDWSFWGWAEINIKPWEHLLKDLKEGNRRSKWIDREPYAYWKGNPYVADARMDLLKCNLSHKQDWNARIYIQNWILESQQGFNQSDLASQCTYRYKIYIEGYAWSVSEKYILACDSVTLMVKPHYYDFFSRSLQPLVHYMPVREYDKCTSIKSAVDWGNRHKQKAQEIGKAASDFIQEDLRMEYVYDFMFHLLNEYAKLLKFEPMVPERAEEICSETMLCHADGVENKFMTDSLVKGPSITRPCILPPPK